MNNHIYSFIIHVTNNLFPINEYSSGEIKKLMDKFKEEADDLNIEIDDAKLESYIQRFDQLKNSPKITEKDLRKYSLSKLIKLVTSSEGADIDDREDTTPDVVYDDDHITIWNGSKEDNCVTYGRGERWCITRGSFSSYRYAGSKGYPTFYLAKNSALPDSDKLSFVAIQVRDAQDDNKKYVYTNRQNNPNESKPMSFSTLMSEVPWLREVPNIKSVLKYIPLSSAEKVTQIYGKSGGEISIRKWVDLPFSTKKQYLVARKDEEELFSDISNNEFVSQYLPQYPQLATFIAITPGILDSVILLKNLDKFSNQDRKSITTNLRNNIDIKELSKENIPFVVKKLLVALNKWDLKYNERLYITKDGNAIVKLTFEDEIKVGVYTAEDDYPNIKLNARTSKYLLDYPELDKIPFNNLLKLVLNNVIDKEFINKILTQAQQDPNSAIVVKDTDAGKLILDSNSFTSYKLEGSKISPIPFNSEEVQNALESETENNSFQENAVNIVFTDENELPPQIDKDAFYKILANTPYANRTRNGAVILLNPEENQIFTTPIDLITSSREISSMYGGPRARDWRYSVGTYERSLSANSWKIYFDYLRSQNRSYTSEQLLSLINNSWTEESKKNIIKANPPMEDNSRIRPAVIDEKPILINTQDPRNSQTVGRRNNLIRVSVPPNVAARVLGGQAAAEPAAAPAAAAGRRGRPAGAAAPAAPAAAGGEANAGVATAIENAGLTPGFNTLPGNIRTRISAGFVSAYTRRNASLDAIGRVIGVINAGQSRFYIIRMPSGRVIGFATMQPDARHYIVTSNNSYRVPRVSQLAAALQQQNINEKSIMKKNQLKEIIKEIIREELSSMITEKNAPAKEKETIEAPPTTKPGTTPKRRGFDKPAPGVQPKPKALKETEKELANKIAQRFLKLKK